MLSYLLFPPMAVDRAALKDPSKFKPTNVTGCVEFPERLELMLRPFDDAVITQLQKWLHPLVIVFSRFLTGVYSVEIASMIPFLLSFVGWEREALLTIYHIVVLLVLTQLPKRFLWRYRPYMKSRAKMVMADRTSSFPARTVACGVAFTYLMVRLWDLRAHDGEVSVGTLLVYMPLPLALAAIVTTVTRVIVGAHYPSDCIIGACVGGFSNLCGEFIYSHVECAVVALQKSVFWSWESFGYSQALGWTVAGLMIVLVCGLRPLLLWKRLPMIAGFLFPSLAFSHVLCPIAIGDEVFQLAPADLRYQQFVLLVTIILAILFSYEYVKPKKVHVSCCFYLVAHGTLFLLLLLQRLAPSGSDSAIIPLQQLNRTVH